MTAPFSDIAAAAPAPEDPAPQAEGAPAPAASPVGGPRTLAEAARQRRDIASGQVMDEARLLRFVAGPDDAVVPDVARKLPGRGLWVEATREAVALAVKRQGFSRAAKRKLSAPADLPDQVEALLAARVLAGLGLAKRAGALISGFDKVQAAVASGRAAWMIEASDGAADGRRKLLQAAHRHGVAGGADARPQLFGAFSSQELGFALGLENVIHAAFLAGRAADAWTVDVQRLGGFRPLLPKSWREEA